MPTLTFRVHYVKDGQNGFVDIGTDAPDPNMDAIRERVRRSMTGCTVGKVKVLKGEHRTVPSSEHFIQPRYETHQMPKRGVPL